MIENFFTSMAGRGVKVVNSVIWDKVEVGKDGSLDDCIV